MDAHRARTGVITSAGLSDLRVVAGTGPSGGFGPQWHVPVSLAAYSCGGRVAGLQPRSPFQTRTGLNRPDRSHTLGSAARGEVRQRPGGEPVAVRFRKMPGRATCAAGRDGGLLRGEGEGGDRWPITELGRCICKCREIFRGRTVPDGLAPRTAGAAGSGNPPEVLRYGQSARQVLELYRPENRGAGSDRGGAPAATGCAFLPTNSAFSPKGRGAGAGAGGRCAAYTLAPEARIRRDHGGDRRGARRRRRGGGGADPSDRAFPGRATWWRGWAVGGGAARGAGRAESPMCCRCRGA